MIKSTAHTRIRRICVIAVLLICVAVLIWCVNVLLVNYLVRLPDETFSSDVLFLEAEETYTELKAQGITVVGNTGSERYNAAVVLVHPKDKYKLWLTKKDVPDERFYRLVRINEEIPVYIEFAYPPNMAY